jgi:uncharacterized Zn finger protein
MPSVAELVMSCLATAGDRERARGRELAGAGAVQLVRFAPLDVRAEVDDDAAHVQLSVVNGELRWRCTCAEGRAGAFCPHCVATALTARRAQ